MKVLDAKGRELVVGSKVLRRTLSGAPVPDQVRGFLWSRRGWVVQTNAMVPMPTAPSYRVDTYRCLDLELAEGGGGR